MILKDIFISFFDLLGFVSFLKNNDNTEMEYRIDHLYRDIEYALSKDQLNNEINGYITHNISHSQINCLTISDSIIFWSNDNSVNAFREIVEVTFLFNQRMTNWNFPVRGALVYGEFGIKKWDDVNSINKTYRANSIYGKGLIRAYELVNSLEWSGAILDDSVTSAVHIQSEIETILSRVAVNYPVPTKHGVKNFYSFFIEKPGFNSEVLKNKIDHIENFIFKGDNKEFDESIERKFSNTIEFLKYLQNYQVPLNL